jgi:hypothetical protein
MSDSLQNRLDEAVTDVLNAIHPGVPTAWVLLAHQASYEDNGDSLSTYPIITMNADLPDHVILGLLAIAEAHVKGTGKFGYISDDDDDEE